MFCHDTQHTGRSEYDTSMNEGKIIWKVKTMAIMGSPDIASDETIYVGGLGPIKNGTLYAINPDGTIKWSKNMPPKTKYGFSYIETTPAIGKDGTIYVGTQEGYLYAFTPEGEEKWNVKLPNIGLHADAIAVDENGTVYAGYGRFLAIYPNGTIKWNISVKKAGFAPTIGKNGTIYVGCYDNYLRAIYPNGTIKWEFKAKEMPTSPAIDDNGMIYVGTISSWGDNRLYALYLNGTLKWEFKPDNEVYGVISYPPAIAEDGTIYFGTGEGRIYAVDKNGIKKWHKYVGQYPTPPVIGKDGTIYIAATKKVSPTYPHEDGYLYAINPDGTIKWRTMLDSDIPYDYCYPSPMAIGKDGRIYIGTWFGSEKEDWGYLYAIGTRERKGEITIDGNDDFTIENGVIEGNGSRENPFLIRGGNFSKLIIKNTDAHFIIEYCNFHDNGLIMENVENAEIKRCDGFSCSTGISLINCSNITITLSSINKNEMGVYMERCSNVTITECTIEENGYGIYAENSYDNLIYFNDIMNNSISAYDNGENSWDNGTVGNHWSDYYSNDENRDGIGDEPYCIEGGNNCDNAPLIESFKVDTVPPIVKILEPEEGYLYINGRKVLSLPVNMTIIIGGMIIAAEAEDAVSGISSMSADAVRMLFKQDNILYHASDNTWYWGKYKNYYGFYILRVKAWDKKGNEARCNENICFDTKRKCKSMF